MGITTIQSLDSGAIVSITAVSADEALSEANHNSPATRVD